VQIDVGGDRRASFPAGAPRRRAAAGVLRGDGDRRDDRAPPTTISAHDASRRIAALVQWFDQLADAHLDGVDLTEDEQAVERAQLWDDLLVTGYTRSGCPRATCQSRNGSASTSWLSRDPSSVGAM
jgi:hypothetical protein